MELTLSSPLSKAGVLLAIVHDVFEKSPFVAFLRNKLPAFLLLFLAPLCRQRNIPPSNLNETICMLEQKIFLGQPE